MLIGAAVFLLALVVVLAVPLTLRFRVSWRKAFEKNAQVEWAFGLARVQIPWAGSRRSLPSPGPRQTRTKETERSSGGARNVLRAIVDRKFRRRIVKFVRNLWRAVYKENIRVRLHIGLDDPADTGRLWGVLGPVAAVLATMQEASIEIEPDFYHEVFEFDSSGTIRVIPLQVVYLVLALALSPSVWRGIRTMRR